MLVGGGLRRRLVAVGRSQPSPPRPQACRGRLRIAYRIIDGQLRGTVEVACHTEAAQALTTLMWSARLDGASHRLLLEALHTAASQGRPASLHLFAATARDLFRHVSKSLAPHPLCHVHCRRSACPASDCLPAPPAGDVDAGSFSLPRDLLAAARDLRIEAHDPPRFTARPRTYCRVNEALSALHGLFASVGRYLEQALRPLGPHAGRRAVRGLILETRAELDDLATRCTDADVYVEDLTESGDNGIHVEVEASLGAAEP